MITIIALILTIAVLIIGIGLIVTMTAFSLPLLIDICVIGTIVFWLIRKVFGRKY